MPVQEPVPPRDSRALLCFLECFVRCANTPSGILAAGAAAQRFHLLFVRSSAPQTGFAGRPAGWRGQPGPQHLGQVGLTNRVAPSSPGEWPSHRLPNRLRTARSIHRSTTRGFRARNTRRGHVSRVPMACSDCRRRRTGMACQCIRELIGGSNDCGGHLFQPLLWQTGSWTRHAHRTEKAPVLSKNRS